MKIVIQRVLSANVTVDEKEIGNIGKGLLLYVCFEAEDTMEQLELAVKKILNLRIFEDDKAKMNKNICQIKGEILSISQFTLSWDGRKGHRPSFDRSMPPNNAKIFYRKFNDLLEKAELKISKGRFAADMKVSSINDGPVTFHLSF